ncbi:glycosyltransferase [Patescibacteria group bacterium]
MKIVVVIPTYNEAENIAKLIPAIDDQFKKYSQHEFIVLVVDGNSPDGTGVVVEDFYEKYPYVQLLLEEKKAGLGAAYMYGFKFAMDKLEADIVIEMDADFQHDPKDLPKLIGAIDDGYDYVLGSRYISGGSIPEEWASYRKLLSIGGSLFSKLMLGIYTVNDFTTGFKATRVKGFLDQLNLDEINSAGFAYKIDLLYKIFKQGAKIKEVPISFGLRDRGDSKMEKDNFMDSLRVVTAIRIGESLSFIKFLFVGFVGLFVDSGLFGLLRLTFLSSSISSAVSGLIAMTTTFTLNNLWSFNDRKLSGVGSIAKNFLVYFIFSYVPIIFRSWLINFSVAKFGDTTLVAFSAFFIGVLVGLIWNYTVYSRIIWKKL